LEVLVLGGGSSVMENWRFASYSFRGFKFFIGYDSIAKVSQSRKGFNRLDVDIFPLT